MEGFDVNKSVSNLVNNASIDVNSVNTLVSTVNKPINNVYQGVSMRKGELMLKYGIEKGVFRSLMLELKEKGLLDTGNRKTVYPKEISIIIEYMGHF